MHVIGRPRKYDAIQISYPPAAAQSSPAQVASNFPAYGYIDPTTSVPSACLKKDGTGSPIVGLSINPPPGYNWAFGFQNIASGTYEVIVTGQTDQQTTWVKI